MSLILLFQKGVTLYDKLVSWISAYVTDALLLIIRLYMASIFFQSGWNKFHNLWSGGWYKTVFLFRVVHPVPYLSPNVAAVLGTGAEVIFPVLLALGIMARVGALGLLGVTAVIAFGVHSHFIHMFWAMLLGVACVIGPGRFSFDGWLRSWWVRTQQTMADHLNGVQLHDRKAYLIIQDQEQKMFVTQPLKGSVAQKRYSQQDLDEGDFITVKSILKPGRSLHVDGANTTDRHSTRTLFRLNNDRL